MNNPRMKRFGFFFSFTVLFMLTALTMTANATSIPEKPKLRIGDDMNYPPYSYIDKQGRATGFNVEVAKAAAIAMGYEVDVRLGEWDLIRKALTKGEIDIISGMVCTQERSKQVDFTKPSIVTNGDIFSMQDDKLQSIQELSGTTVVVQRGDFMAEYLQSLDLNIQLVQVPDVKSALQAVKEGQYPYAGVSTLSGLYTLQRERISGIYPQGFSLAPQDFCMAVQKGDETLQQTLNAGLQIIKATGEYDQIYDRFITAYQAHTVPELLKKYSNAITMIMVTIFSLVCLAILLNQMVRVKTKALQTANDTLHTKQQEMTQLISELRSLETALSQERNLFQITLQSLGDGVISTDKNGTLSLMNAVAEELTGWTYAEAKGLPFHQVFRVVNTFESEKDNPAALQTSSRIGSLELTPHISLISKSGSAIPIEENMAAIKDAEGNINGIVIVFRDATEKRDKLEKIEFLSHHDQLTKIYNRHYFEEQLSLLDAADMLPLTVVMADVNGLKLTNDAFGHKAGDALLIKVAQILQKECRDTDVVARIGGDEFVLLFPHTTRVEAEKIISRYVAAIDKERKNNMIISISFGWETRESLDRSISEVFIKAEEHMYRKKLVESQSMRNQTIIVIMQTLHETNPRERNHSERVSHISRNIGEAMHLDSDALKELETAALMHDIGKIAVNENLLNKTGKLSAHEFEEMKRHSEIGYHILKSVDSYTNLAEHILSHHERWDGKGYPRGLAGEEISLIARIIAVSDAFEAMIGERPYRASISPGEALEEMKRFSGTQFDPSIVEVLFKPKVLQYLETGLLD